MKKIDIPSIARLTRVVENEGEHSSCSLVFELETETGHTFRMTYGTMIDALRFAQEQAVIPALSVDWWARIGRTDGCVFQSQSGA